MAKKGYKAKFGYIKHSALKIGIYINKTLIQIVA